VAITTALMKISPNWRVFKTHYEKAFADPNAPKQESLFSDDDED
jgi:hypothetical protein